MPFLKICPARSSTPASPLLERHKKFAKIDKISRKCNFQNSDPPEAALLLDPCLEVTTKIVKIDKSLKEVLFLKNLTRRRQHHC